MSLDCSSKQTTTTMAKFVCIALALCAMVALVSSEETLGACSSRVLNNLESQIELCARNVPVQRFSNPARACAQSVQSSLRRGSSCSLDSVPELLESCLEAKYISTSYITPAVECIRNAVSYGICC